ncbi:hypothetical protein F5882DRAFT_438111 [Hyaloscypha sp. PMI_1271]|nr:hypothetical protein F5882DRAFT_438111 [Hyaloscypha sp. PMI_1271]
MNEHGRDIHATIAKGRELMDIELAHNDPERLHCATAIAHAVYEMIDVDTDLDCLNETISIMKEAQSSLAPICKPARDFVQHLAIFLFTRFEKTSDRRDLDETISLMLSTFPDTVDQCDVAAQLFTLEVLVRALSTRHKLNPNIDIQAPAKDLNDALRFSRLLLLVPLPDYTRYDFTMRASELCFLAFQYYNDSTLLDEGIRHLQQLDEAKLDLDGEDQSVYMMYFSDLLWQRFENSLDLGDLDESIKRGSDAVARNPNGVPHLFLHYHAARLSRRHRLKEVETDLDDSIKFDNRAIELAPNDDPALADYYLDLGVRCQLKYEITTNMTDLERAITTNRSALDATPRGHKRRPESLNNLGLLIFYRFELLNLEDDLYETLILLQEAVAASAVESTGWRRRLTNLIVRTVPLLSLQAAESRMPLTFSIDQQQWEAALYSNAASASNACSVAALLKANLPLKNSSQALLIAISLAQEGLRATKPYDPETASRKFLLGELLDMKAEGSLELDNIEDLERHWRDARMMDNPPARYVPEMLHRLSKVPLLKHTKGDDA